MPFDGSVPEGLLFALAGGVALAAATLAGRDRRRLVQAAKAIGAMLAIVLPWQLYCAAYGLSTPDYDLAHVANPSYLRANADRLWPVAKELWRQAVTVHGWGLLTFVVLLALVAGLTAGRWRLLLFAGSWLVLALGGLLVTY